MTSSQINIQSTLIGTFYRSSGCNIIKRIRSSGRKCNLVVKTFSLRESREREDCEADFWYHLRSGVDNLVDRCDNLVGAAYFEYSDYANGECPEHKSI